MRCREARDRIARAHGSQVGQVEDPSLRDHLRVCRDCAAHAAATGLLDRLLDTAGENDQGNQTPIDVQRQQVETRAQQSPAGRQPGLLSRLWPAGLKLRPRPVFYLSTAAATIILVVLAVVPFSFYRTVGYDLNLDGVSLELAQNDEHICDLLHRLGLFEAGVDVIDCDTTCCLSILDLKSEQEAILVVGAIARLNDAELTTSLTPIRAKTSRSLLEHANAIIRRGES